MRLSMMDRYFLLLWFVFLTGRAVAAQPYAPGACSLIPNPQTCVDSTPCKTDITGVPVCLVGAPLPTGGVTVNQTCWQYSYQYACASNDVNTCSAYQNSSGCQVVGSTCMDKTPGTGQCNEWQYTYQCQTQAAQTQQQLSCSGGLINAPTIATPSNPNFTFPQAAVAQEILNEGSTYNNHGILFGGVQETCTKGDLGIHNCCKSSPGAHTNGQVMQIAVGAAASTVKYAGSAAIDWASPYVYDAMYSNGIWTNGMASGMGTNLTASGFSIGAYGFTYSTVNAAGTGLMGGTTNIVGNASSGYLEFNPYTFAAAVAIAYLQSLSACTSEEQLLAMHKGANLSTYINETCSSSMFGLSSICTDTYCSFNSVLAEIINIQGKTQLGLPIANCQGITPAQLSQINFTKINFSAFTQSMLQNAQNSSPTSSSMSSGYSPILQNTPSGSSQNPRSSTLPAYH